MKPALPILLTTITLHLAGCSVTLPASSSSPDSGPTPAFIGHPATPESESCFDFVQPSPRAPLSTFEWIDGEEGEYRLESMKMSERVSAIEGSALQIGAQANESNASYACSEKSGDLSLLQFEDFVRLPVAIRRRDGRLDRVFELRLSSSPLTHVTLTSGSASPPADASDIQTLIVRMSELGLKVEVARPTSETLQIFVTGANTYAGTNSEFRALGTYTYRKIATPAASPSPAISPSPTPVVSPFPGLFPSSSPSTIPTPAARPTSTAAPANTRCGISGLSVTIDGRSAFTLLDGSQRLDALKALAASGYCAAPSRLGISGFSITLDGESAFTFLDTHERLKQLIRLFAAGMDSAWFTRCSVRGFSITLNGNTAFTCIDPQERIFKLLELGEAGLCAR